MYELDHRIQLSRNDMTLLPMTSLTLWIPLQYHVNKISKQEASLRRQLITTMNRKKIVEEACQGALVECAESSGISCHELNYKLSIYMVSMLCVDVWIYQRLNKIFLLKKIRWGEKEEEPTYTYTYFFTNNIYIYVYVYK